MVILLSRGLAQGLIWFCGSFGELCEGVEGLGGGGGGVVGGDMQGGFVYELGLVV